MVQCIIWGIFNFGKYMKKISRIFQIMVVIIIKIITFNLCKRPTLEQPQGNSRSEYINTVQNKSRYNNALEMSKLVYRGNKRRYIGI